MRTPMGGPNSLQFFWEILAKSYLGASPRRVGAPPRGNPGSATVFTQVTAIYNYLILEMKLQQAALAITARES